MDIEIIEKQNINRIFKSEEFTRKKIAQKISLYKKFIYLCRTISVLSAISLILILCNVLKIASPNIITTVIMSIGFPLGFSELLNLNIKNYEKKFKSNIKSKIMPILIEKLSNIEKINNAYNIEDLKHSGLFSIEDGFEEDDSFIFNYKNKKAYITDGEVFSYISKHRQKGHFKRWLLIGFYTEKGRNHQTVIKTKTDNASWKSPNVIGGIFFLSITLLLSYMYYLNPVKNEAGIVYLTFLILFFIISISFFFTNSNPEVKTWIKKEKVMLEDVKLMKYFDIKSSNQFEVRYFLTPSFIEKFLKIQNTFKTNDVRCAFYQNKVILAIRIYEDLFEVANINEPLISQKYIRKTIKQLNTIKKLILALDEDK